MMAPVMEALGEEVDSSKAKIAKMSVEENQEIPGKYQVMSIPTFLIFKGGELAEQLVGGMPKEKIMEALERHM